MIVDFNLCQIAIFGVLSIHSAHAQDRFESFAITLTPRQFVLTMRLAESVTDGHRTELALNVVQVVKTEISLVTIVQVSTTTIKEVVRVTETIRGTCAAVPVNTLSFGNCEAYLDPEQSTAEGPFTILAGADSRLAATPKSTVSILGNIVPNSSNTRPKNGSLSKGHPNTDFHMSASGSRPCDCQCLCPKSSFPIFKVVTASPISVISTFQTLPSFVTPGQSISQLAPSEPSPVIPAQIAGDATTSTLSSEFPPPSFVSTPNLISPDNIPFDIKTFSLLDEVTVPLNI